MSALAIYQSPYWHVAGWTMVHFLWLASAFALVAVPGRGFLRGCHPNTRYGYALACFIAIAVTPAFIAARLCWNMPPANVLAPQSTRGSESNNIDRKPDRIIVVTLPGTGAARAIERSSIPIETARPTSLALARESSGVAESLRRLLSAATVYLPWLWLTGTPMAFGVLLMGVAGANRLRRTSRPLTDSNVVALHQQLVQALRIGRRVAVALSDRVASPVLIGVVRPLILLPPAILAGCTPGQLEMILLHELAHVRRWDNWVNLCQRVVEAILFFHPVVWLVSGWVRLEREHCCDALVVARSGNARGYAETLASLVMPGIAARHAAAAMANPNLVVRIRHILNVEDRSMRISRQSLITVAGTLLAGLAVAFVLYTRAATAQEGAGATGASGSASAASEPSGPQEPSASIEQSAGSSGSTSESDRTERAIRSYIRRLDKDDIVSLTTKWSVMGLELKRAWGPEQATGAPDTLRAGDFETAWASMSRDDQEEWLELAYREPVEAIAVLVFESYNPGALSRVEVYGAEGQAVAYSWKGKDPTPPDRLKGVSFIPIPADVTTGKVKIFLDSPAVPGWNEIDAVGLLDSQGRIHWAESAAASSTYGDAITHGEVLLNPAEPGAPTGLKLGQPAAQDDRLQRLEEATMRRQYGAVQLAAQDDRLQRLEEELRELRKMIEDLKSALAPGGPGSGEPSTDQ